MGCGVKQDGLKALAWYTKAADQGNNTVQVLIGLIYEYGKAGIPKDNAKVIEWYTKGAEQGSGAAKEALKRLQ